MLRTYGAPQMTLPLKLRQTGFRLPQGEWFNDIVNAFNQYFNSSSIQTIAAAGATQGNATPIPTTRGRIIKVTVTASTQGVKLPVASTGLQMDVLADPSVGVKVYPAAGGIIGAAATNAAVALAKNKVNTYYAVDKTHWRTATGA
jgi:hypothetical protein